MRVPLSWLRDYVDLMIPIEELADRLTFAGVEVEQIEYLGIPRPKQSHATGERPELAWDRDKLVVGKIIAVKPHPNADRLTLAIVDIARGESIQVVTGAPNIKVGESGQMVAFALEGSTLFDGHKEGWDLMTLKRAKIRGIESGCMVCSEKELGLSEDHEGIILLPDDAPAGKSLVDYLGDVVFEIKINPNMARCASIVGIAREVAALTGKRLKMPSLDVVQKGASIKGQVEVRILEPELNPRFTAALIRDVAIKPSPFWVQRRLKLAGMRPINNIVDVTNYVMLEIGQPLHAFDYDTLVDRAGKRSPTIITRLADPGEELETLDGVKRKLDPFNILVCDTKGSLSLGGIMGGAESEINDHSKNILLEAAAWNYLNIRRTMTAQHLASEAGTRFGRGVHPSQAIIGLQRAIEMMRELGGGEIAKGLIDVYPFKPKKMTIDLPIAEVKRQLGVEIPRKDIVKYLESLEFEVQSIKSKGKSKSSNLQPPVSNLHVIPPDHRLDVDGTDDLIEEVARLYGYDKIPISRMNDELPPQRANVELEQEEFVRDLLIDAGLQEVIGYRFTTPEREAKLMILATHVASASQVVRPPREYVRIENPISADRAALRQTLLPNLLELTASNLRYRARVAAFEIGPVFWHRGADDALLPRETATQIPEDNGLKLPLERRRVGIILTGPREDMHWEKADTTLMDFFDLKGIVQALLDGLHITGAKFSPSDHPALHPRRAATLQINARDIGVLGELHPLLLEKFDLPAQSVLVAEFDLDAMLERVSTMYAVRSLSRYPGVVQDLALVVDEDVVGERVHALIRETGGALLQRAVLFDVYNGVQVPPGKKSLAYQLTFQASDRTLSDADATQARQKIVARLQKEIGAQVRGG